MQAQGYSKKGVAIIVHVFCWTLLFSLPFLLRPSFDENRKLLAENHTGFMYINIVNRMAWIGLFYLNANVIIPLTLYRKKFWGYALFVVLVMLALLLIDWTFFRLFIEGVDYKIKNFFSFNIFPILFVLVSSTAYRMIQDRMESDRRMKEKENENLKTELSFLRSQVSPHFMFNVLNNMVALARKKSDLLEPSLIKLSSLLRYMLYETDEDKVPLEKEVDYLQSYIDLQKQRFGKNVIIKTSLHDIDNGYSIEPMLLIPFVENAFKHGTGLIADAQIDIELSVRHGLLQFLVRNRYNVEADEPKDKTSGIGLTNVKRRLNLLYRDRHTLLIDKREGWFTASLQVNLH